MSTYPVNVFKISDDGKTEAYFKDLTSDAQLISTVYAHPERGTTAGYQIGGKINWPISSGAFGNNIEKFPFSITSGSSTDVGEISKGFSYHKGFQSDTTAYVTEGDTASSNGRQNTGFEKFPFSVPVATSTTIPITSMGISDDSPSEDASGKMYVVSELDNAYFINVTPGFSGASLEAFTMFDTSDPIFSSGIKPDQIAFKFKFSSETISTLPGTHTLLYASNTDIANTAGGPTPFYPGGGTTGSFEGDVFQLNGKAWIGDTAAYFSGNANGGAPQSSQYAFITQMPFSSEALSVATTQIVNHPDNPISPGLLHSSSVFLETGTPNPGGTASSPTDGYYTEPTVPAFGNNKVWMKWPFNNFISTSEIAEFQDTGLAIFAHSTGTSTTDVFTTGGGRNPSSPNNTFDTIEKFPFARSSTGTMTDVGELINTLYFSTMAVD